MRIALVSQEYPPHTAHGGIATQTHTKAHGLAALGHQIYVISHSTDAYRHDYSDRSVHVTRIPGFDAKLPLQTEPARWLTYSALVAAEVSALHARVGLDLIDFPEWGGEGFIYLLNRTEWRAVPVVIHLHGPLVMLANTIGWPEKGSELFMIGTMMESTCLRLADAVISSSRCAANWCAERYGIDPGRIEVLHTGVDTVRFHPVARQTGGAPEIVFVGRVAASKGVDTLVDAACRIAPEFPGLRVRLVGRAEPAFASTLNERTRRAGFPDLLQFVGFVSAEHLTHELTRAHVFASPSRYEGGPGFVYLEAMACGLAVVASSGSGVAEVVDHERTGMLVPPDDLFALSDTLHRLLSDAPLRARLGAAARQYVETQANSRDCVRSFESFYARFAKVLS